MSDVRYCLSCGAQVKANERFCGNCGARMEPTAAAPAAPTIPLGQQGAQPTQALPPAFGGPPADSPGSFSVPAGASATPPRRGLPVWAIILLSLVGLCAIGCVASIALTTMMGARVSSVFSTVEAGLESTARPTGQGGGIVPVATRTSGRPTPRPSDEVPAPTAAAIPTAAPTRTGGGIVGGIGVDASAARTAEAATAAAEQADVAAIAATAEAELVNAEVAALIASGQEAFRDEFVDNRNAWFTGVFEEIETDKIEDGVFKVIWAANGTSYELYEVREIANFVAEVDCLIYQGGLDGSCGLVFDQEDDVGFYKFEIFDDYYRLFAVLPEGDPTILAEGDPAGIINAGGVNRLRVVRQGEQIRIFLNGALLDTVSDSTYSSGKIGVSTNSYSESGGVEIWFDNFIIWELP